MKTTLNSNGDVKGKRGKVSPWHADKEINPQFSSLNSQPDSVLRLDTRTVDPNFLLLSSALCMQTHMLTKASHFSLV